MDSVDTTCYGLGIEGGKNRDKYWIPEDKMGNTLDLFLAFNFLSNFLKKLSKLYSQFIHILANLKHRVFLLLKPNPFVNFHSWPILFLSFLPRA